MSRPSVQGLDRRPPTEPYKRQKPRQLFATAGVSAEKGDMILERTGKGQTVFAQLLYAPRPPAQSARDAPTQSRYTCDGAVKWYLLPGFIAGAMLCQRLSQTTSRLRTSPMTSCHDPFPSVPNGSILKCRAWVGLLSQMTPRLPRWSRRKLANVGQ